MEHFREIENKRTLWEKLYIPVWSFFDDLRIKVLVLLGKCPHEATFGRVNDKKCYCLYCKQIINNTDYENNTW